MLRKIIYVSELKLGDMIPYGSDIGIVVSLFPVVILLPFKLMEWRGNTIAAYKHG